MGTGTRAGALLQCPYQLLHLFTSEHLARFDRSPLADAADNRPLNLLFDPRLGPLNRLSNLHENLGRVSASEHRRQRSHQKCVLAKGLDIKAKLTQCLQILLHKGSCLRRHLNCDWVKQSLSNRFVSGALSHHPFIQHALVGSMLI